VPKAPNGFVGRGVPDVAVMPIRRRLQRFRDGQQTVIGHKRGAPLWAGLLALINESLGQIGLRQWLLYSAKVEPLSRHHFGKQWRLFRG